MHNEGYPFVLDIGTEAGDFTARYNTIADAWNEKGSVPDFIHFSVGLWPSRTAIRHRHAVLQLLENDLHTLLRSGQRYAAIGECGIDRYWNHPDAEVGVGVGAGTSFASGAGTDLDSGVGTSDLVGEEELFCEQLSLAKRYGLAVIIHSRDGFTPTLHCIDEVGWHRGVIHCFSYGKKEAEAFLERGWYLSFPGTITYTSDTDAASIADLLSIVPDDKLLLETDAPYLTPDPVRRQVNTPLNIAYTYQAASQYRQCSIDTLCKIVYQNCCHLFSYDLTPYRQNSFSQTAGSR